MSPEVAARAAARWSSAHVPISDELVRGEVRSDLFVLNQNTTPVDCGRRLSDRVTIDYFFFQLLFLLPEVPYHIVDILRPVVP